MPSESEAATLRVAQGVPVFAILRRLISGDAVLEVCRHIVIPADRVVLEYGIEVAAPAPGDLTNSFAQRPGCVVVCGISVSEPGLTCRLTGR
jgi:hypothetical protein